MSNEPKGDYWSFWLLVVLAALTAFAIGDLRRRVAAIEDANEVKVQK